MERAVLPGLGLDTVTEAELELFAAVVSVSPVAPFTLAVLLMSPGLEGAVTVMVKDLVAPLASDPPVQVTVPEAFVQPLEAEENVTPAGRVSVTVELLEASGPLFVTVSV